MAKTVEVKLSGDSIDSLIGKLESYSSSLEQRNQVLLADMADEGEGFARLAYDQYQYDFETGETRTSISGRVEGDSAVVGAGGHAYEVEFGFGIVGSEHSHEEWPGSYTTAGYPKRFRDPKTGRRYKTYGRESRPFLWPTMQYWREIAFGRIKEWFEWQ